MGGTIDKIDDGFYICGVDALKDSEHLKGLGITHILNAASLELYRYGGSAGGAGGLQTLTDRFKVKSLECEDSEACNLSVHFHDLADFIEEGRQAGGVVVHCAAGISRASTSSCAYLMIKQNLSLEAALCKVHSVRNVVHPNSGFWKQLRDLEAVLRLQGAELQPLQPRAAPSAEEPAAGQPQAQSQERGQEFRALLAELDGSLGRMRPFATHFLAARLQPSDGMSPADLAGCLRTGGAAGVVWQELEPGAEGSLGVRAKVVPSMDAATFKALLEATPGVQSVVSE